MIGEINDSHAAGENGFNSIRAIRGSKYAPIRVWFIEDKLVITDYYNPEFKTSIGLEIGDIITHINGKTIIIGSSTAGANGNVSTIVLPSGLQSYISGISIYYPDGTQTQRVGIIPDIWVEPTIQGIREGRDELLEMAIELINKE